MLLFSHFVTFCPIVTRCFWCDILSTRVGVCVCVCARVLQPMDKCAVCPNNLTLDIVSQTEQK